MDPAGAALPGATVTLENDLSGSAQQTVSGADGSFIFYNVPNNPYHLRATLDGFADFHADVDVRGSVPLEPKVEMTPAFSGSTTVTAEKENVELETGDSSSHTDIDKSLVRRFAAPVASRAFEAIVLSAPGFSQDENGRYHFQGGHSQQLLVIDGQPIGDQVGVTFSNSLNPAIAEGIEIVTGGVPAEYGEKAFGVINLTTRSALGTTASTVTRESARRGSRRWRDRPRRAGAARGPVSSSISTPRSPIASSIRFPSTTSTITAIPAGSSAAGTGSPSRLGLLPADRQRR